MNQNVDTGRGQGGVSPAALMAYLASRNLLIDQQTAQEWSQRLPEITGRPDSELLSGLRYMVYQTFLREQKRAKAKGERYRGRSDQENALVVRYLCDFAGAHYERPRDPVREAAFAAAHRDPFAQAKWFEELDIMN